MNVFYATDTENDKILLKDQEAQHCRKVLRKGKGTKVYVIDGKGSRYTCIILDIGRNAVSLEILDQEQFERKENLPHLAFGIIKNTTRLETLLEKVTEIGVTRITPLICTRSEKSTIKKDRLDKILVSAMKQSLNFHLPILDEPVFVKDFCSEIESKNRFIASYGPEVPELSSIQGRNTDPVIMIGPEGDFTKEELDMALERQFQRVNLGETRLRAETAAIVACTLLQFG